jgi:hypothetical protein
MKEEEKQEGPEGSTSLRVARSACLSFFFVSFSFDRASSWSFLCRSSRTKSPQVNAAFLQDPRALLVHRVRQVVDDLFDTTLDL